MKTLQTITYTNVDAITSSYDYYQVVLNVADTVISAINEAMERGDCEFNLDSVEDFLNDSCLHESVDGSEFAIYNCYHLPIIQHSDSCDYFIDNFGSEQAGEILANEGLSSLHGAIAFYALYEDVREVVQGIIDNTDFDIEEDQD